MKTLFNKSLLISAGTAFLLGSIFWLHSGALVSLCGSCRRRLEPLGVCCCARNLQSFLPKVNLKQGLLSGAEGGTLALITPASLKDKDVSAGNLQRWGGGLMRKSFGKMTTQHAVFVWGLNNEENVSVWWVTLSPAGINPPEPLRSPSCTSQLKTCIKSGAAFKANAARRRKKQGKMAQREKILAGSDEALLLLKKKKHLGVLAPKDKQE